MIVSQSKLKGVDVFLYIFVNIILYVKKKLIHLRMKQYIILLLGPQNSSAIFSLRIQLLIDDMCHVFMVLTPFSDISHI